MRNVNIGRASRVTSVRGAPLKGPVSNLGAALTKAANANGPVNGPGTVISGLAPSPTPLSGPGPSSNLD